MIRSIQVFKTLKETTCDQQLQNQQHPQKANQQATISHYIDTSDSKHWMKFVSFPKNHHKKSLPSIQSKSFSCNNNDQSSFQPAHKNTLFSTQINHFLASKAPSQTNHLNHNLEAYQHNEDIHFRSVRGISPHEGLVVWLGEDYLASIRNASYLSCELFVC